MRSQQETKPWCISLLGKHPGMLPPTISATLEQSFYSLVVRLRSIPLYYRNRNVPVQ
jgi:hypothetical protein